MLESILEGYLLHYGRSRLVDTADEDLRLLAGDHLYALGLSRLASLGDLDAVRALADLITLCARAHADARRERWSRTGPGGAVAADAPWPWGAAHGREYERSLEAAHRGRAGADELLSEARRRAAELGVELQSQAALIAFERAVADRPHA